MKKHSMLSEIWRRFKKNKQALVGLIVLIIFVLIAIFADQIAPYGYDDQDASRAMIHPCADFIFGTDNLGRDQLSRLIYGSRYSLAIGFLAVGISVITGGILGVLAAYYHRSGRDDPGTGAGANEKAETGIPDLSDPYHP